MGFQVVYQGRLEPLKSMSLPVQQRVKKLEHISNYRKIAEGEEKPTPEKDSSHVHQHPLADYRIPQNLYKQQRERRPTLLANQIMTFPVTTLIPESSIKEACELFRKHRFRHIPVLSKEKKITGILSDRVLFHEIANDHHAGPVSSNHTIFQRTIHDLITAKVITAKPETEIRKIARVLIGEHIGVMPIINEEGCLVGIITRSDILRALVNQSHLDLWL